MKYNFLVIIQARLGSTRYPDKVLEKLGKKTLIETIVKRLSKSKLVDKIIVATTNNKKDKKLVNLLKKKKINFYTGDERNVLLRYYSLAKKFKPTHVVRVCGDCPFSDYKILDKMIQLVKTRNYDYISNTNPPTFPDGLDLEVFSTKSLLEARKKAKHSFDKEHVTPFIIRNTKNSYNLSLERDYSKYRLTIDEPKDFGVIENTFEKLKYKNYFDYKDILKLIDKFPKIFDKNINIQRNIGSKISTGQKLWSRAKNIIPGGNMLLSKRPEMFLPNLWPTYFSKSKGCNVWDLDGKKYIDLASMSVGTNILGYANSKVDTAVKKSINEGNMSTLNCPEEVYLAEKLTKMHKDLDMVRFAKTGGEANSIAIRIARAFSKRDNVAICGYHGWHDWYLSANIASSKNLNQHLLTGLSTSGVPKKLKNTAYPFEYNNIKKFFEICKKNNIGVVKMEVYRNFSPKNNFLKKIRNFCTKNKIVLIFDECTSGFRETFGGLHKKYGVIPDICIFGKALGNGYPITAIVGKRNIMQSAQSTFISSTFWTERTGYVAALKTLEEMYKIRSWEKISKLGKFIKKNWLKSARKHKLKINIVGLDSIPSFSIDSKRWIKYKSYFTYRMLKNNILASSYIFLSVAHNRLVLKKYFKILNEIFKEISIFESGKNLETLEKIPESHTGFKRLN
jgi:glutamate-1-semialdehyde aminotransferase/spore coat polysaccharide biosynthesis protein SpsF (cytidylyltransferase family)